MTIDRRTHTRTREKTHFKTLSFKESLYRAHNLFSPLTSHVTSLFQHTRAHDPVGVAGPVDPAGPTHGVSPPRLADVWAQPHPRVAVIHAGVAWAMASTGYPPAAEAQMLRWFLFSSLLFFFEFVWIGFIGRSETGYPAGYSSTRKTHQGICSESSAPYDVPQFFLLFFFVYEGKIARLASHRAYYCTNYCSIFGISSYLISPVGLTQLITNRIVSLLIEYNNMWFRFFSTFKLLYWQSDNG